jgi:hypothetical protein
MREYITIVLNARKRINQETPSHHIYQQVTEIGAKLIYTILPFLRLRFKVKELRSFVQREKH